MLVLVKGCSLLYLLYDQTGGGTVCSHRSSLPTPLRDSSVFRAENNRALSGRRSSFYYSSHQLVAWTYIANHALCGTKKDNDRYGDVEDDDEGDDALNAKRSDEISSLPKRTEHHPVTPGTVKLGNHNSRATSLNGVYNTRNDTPAAARRVLLSNEPTASTPSTPLRNQEALDETRSMMQQFTQDLYILNNAALIQAVWAANKQGGQLITFHQGVAGRCRIMLRTGEDGAFLRVVNLDGSGYSDHSLPVDLRFMQNVRNKTGKEAKLADMLGLTAEQAIACVVGETAATVHPKTNPSTLPPKDAIRTPRTKVTSPETTPRAIHSITTPSNRVVSTSTVMASTTTLSSTIPTFWQPCLPSTRLASLRCIPTRTFAALIQNAFDPFRAHAATLDVSALDSLDLVKQTDVLHAILHHRLRQHIATKVKSARALDKTQYIWDFVSANLGRMAAAMVVMGHVAPLDKLQLCAQDNVDDDGYLLADSSHFVPLQSIAGYQDVLQGCYLAHFQNMGFVRSGKVAHRPARVRLEAHQQRALKPGPQWTKPGDEWRSLQRGFPSRLAEFDNPHRIGYFEDLQFFAGLSFSVQSPHPSIYATDGSGVFVWTQSVLDEMLHLKEDAIDFVAYLCELTYRLALAPCRNCDRSTSGFERPIRQSMGYKKCTVRPSSAGTRCIIRITPSWTRQTFAKERSQWRWRWRSRGQNSWNGRSKTTPRSVWNGKRQFSSAWNRQRGITKASLGGRTPSRTTAKSATSSWGSSSNGGKYRGNTAAQRARYSSGASRYYSTSAPSRSAGKTGYASKRASAGATYRTSTTSAWNGRASGVRKTGAAKSSSSGWGRRSTGTGTAAKASPGVSGRGRTTTTTTASSSSPRKSTGRTGTARSKSNASERPRTKSSSGGSSGGGGGRRTTTASTGTGSGWKGRRTSGRASSRWR